MGATCTRHSLCPLIEGHDEDAELGREMRRGDALSHPLRHCERSEAIHSAASGGMDCFAALAM